MRDDGDCLRHHQPHRRARLRRRLARLQSWPLGIENRLHWVRDVSLGEDACRAKAEHCPQNLAALRNVGLTLMRAAGLNEILPTLRDFATRPQDLLKFLRIVKQ